jgi:hypothetical protein
MMPMFTHDLPLKVATTGYLSLSEGHGVLVAAELVYRPRDCLAVNMLLCGPDGVEAAWTFAWELLARGLVAPAGEGDVTVRPVRGTVPAVEVLLASSFSASMRFPARDVGYFISKVRARALSDARHISTSLAAELAGITESI